MRLLDEAEATLDVDARREIMAQLQTMLQEDAVFVQPYWRSIHTAGSPRVKGYSHHPAEETPFRNGVARSLMRILQESARSPSPQGRDQGWGWPRWQNLRRGSATRCVSPHPQSLPAGEGGLVRAS